MTGQMKRIIEHEKYGKVLFDTNTQEYEYIDKEFLEVFSLNGKSERYFDNTKIFLESSAKVGVVPFICSNIGQHKRRTFIELIDNTNMSRKFFNVEMINYKWTDNKIAYAKKGNCYLVILLRNSQAMHDFLIASMKELKKGNAQHVP